VIGSLRGRLLESHPRPGGGLEVLVEVGGVGYRAVVPATAMQTRPGEGLFLHVHTHVREDAIVLYGFATREERVCFEALIGAHGVGPAVALGLLSVHSPAALRRAVATDDADALMLVPGIGRKTATRLIVELKSRLDADMDGPLPEPVMPGGAGSARAEVRTALASLGYAADEIRQAMVALPDEGSVEDHLRLALRELAAAR
jgi:Holliday junction DNA helicase RuvA